MKTTKKLALVACAFIFSFVCTVLTPLEAQAAGSDVYWKFDDTTKTLYISDTNAAGYTTFTASEQNAATYGSGTYGWIQNPSVQGVKKVVIEGTPSPASTKCWFSAMVDLTTITGLDKLDTSNVTDMSYMFCYAYSLDNLNWPNLNAQNVTDMSYMFYDCDALKTLNLPNANMSKVTDMSYMFYSCDALQTVNLSNLNAQNVTNMFGMFYQCAALTSVDLSNLNAPNVTDMGYMFYECAALTSVDLSNSNTSNVTDMVSMFQGCSSLKDLNLSGFDTSNVINMVSMFKDCSSLEDLDLSSFDTSKVEWMFHMFYGCKKLRTLNISSFDTSAVKDMTYMFYNCASLVNLDVSNFDTSKVSDMNQMFAGCSSLTELDLTSFDTSSIGTRNQTDSIYGMFRDCTNLKTIYVKSGTDWNRAADAGVFQNCSSLVGGNGTAYDAANVGGNYAIVDGLRGAPGYFTVKEYEITLDMNGGKIKDATDAWQDKVSMKFPAGYGQEVPTVEWMNAEIVGDGTIKAPADSEYVGVEITDKNGTKTYKPGEFYQPVSDATVKVLWKSTATPTPTADPTTADSTTAGTGTGAGGLSVTGAEIAGGIAVAVVLLGLGVGLAMRAKRYRA